TSTSPRSNSSNRPSAPTTARCCSSPTIAASSTPCRSTAPSSSAGIVRRAAADRLDAAERAPEHPRMDLAARDARIEKYRSGVSAVEDALRGADDAALDRRPAPGEWTAREVAHHLADSETMSSIRLRRLIAEDEPLIPAYDEQEFARRLHYDRPIAASVTLFAAVRTANLSLLDALREDE